MFPEFEMSRGTRLAGEPLARSPRNNDRGALPLRWFLALDLDGVPSIPIPAVCLKLKGVECKQ
jgi:hypothetical protein